MQFQNPIISGFHPDPSICRVGEDYFLVTSSFEYFPGIPVFHSTNLVEWKLIGHCIENPETLPLMIGNPNASGIYAPTIRYHEGRFYVICTNIATAEMEDSRYGNFIVTAESPYGPWSDPVWVDFPGIDPSLFWDDDGSAYCCGSNQGAYLCKINPDTGELLSEGKVVWEGTGGCCPEGPHLYKKGGWYYLMIAEGGTEYGHMETIARSRQVEGPYEAYEKNPIISNRSLGAGIMGTGHADLIEDCAGNWWGVCLGIRPITYPPKYNLGRETFLFPVEWTEDGWPVCGKDGVIEESYVVGRKEVQMACTDASTESVVSWKQENERAGIVKMPVAGIEYEWEEDFSTDRLSPRFVYLYNPDRSSGMKHNILWKKDKGLTLRGMASNLSDAAENTFLGVRQEHHECSICCDLRFEPQQEGEEAGLSIFMNRNHHYEIALTYIAGKSKLIFRRRIGSLWKVEQEVEYELPEVFLRIDATKEFYCFSYSKDGAAYVELGKGETAYLTTEVGGAFTGNLFALYATGNGRFCVDDAIVRWVTYKGK